MTPTVRHVHRRGEHAAGGDRSRQKTKRHALPRVVFVVGPTSSGKTALGIRLAKLLKGEVINADARQVYREVSIGTGKPKGRRTRVGSRGVYMVEGIPHYLMDFLAPDKPYSVAEWCEAALKAIRGITKRGKVPIVVGGTGLYVSALLDNYQFPRVEAQPAMREALASKSLEDLVRALLVADPGASGVVDLKNKRRVIRALEVVTFSGMKFSEARGKADPLVEGFQVAIKHSPEDLYRRMEQTIDQMVEDGLFDEVKRLMARGIPLSAPAMTSIGYPDLVRALKGELTREQAIALLKRRTRQYTKRQITWFKRDQRIHWAKDEDDAIKTVKKWVKKSV
jgi:tRNA dimethylallyltransferase